MTPLPKSKLPSLYPSRPLISLNASASGFFLFTRKYAERSAASITPPVTPKITPAPLPTPRGLSKSISFIPLGLTIVDSSNLSSSLVVNTASIS